MESGEGFPGNGRTLTSPPPRQTKKKATHPGKAVLGKAGHVAAHLAALLGEAALPGGSENRESGK